MKLPSIDFLKRTARVVRDIEQQAAEGSGRVRSNRDTRVGFFAKVIGCKITSGTGQGFFEMKEVGDVSFDADGRLTGTVLTGAQSFYAFGGLLGWSEKNDVVSVIPHCGSVNGKPVCWRIYDDQMGLNYNNSPTADSATLASTQDSPGVHSFCTDTVTPT